MRHVDTLLKARWIIPLDDANTVLEHHTVAIDQGKIVGILPSVELPRHFTANHTHYLDQHAVLPGFVNAHTHAAMNLMRGYADDLKLMDWLQNYIWPAEAATVSAEMVYDGSLHAMLEMIQSGTTCFNDMYFYALDTARAAHHAGLRGLVSETIFNVPTPWSADVSVCFEKNLKLLEDIQAYPLIGASLAMHAPYTVDEGIIRQVRNLAQDYDCRIHMHVHETQGEVDQYLHKHQLRPLQHLQQLDLCSPRLMAIHLTALTTEDISILARHGVHAVHCPESNMKLASGIAPVSSLLAAGVNVALGTDGAASNNDLDLFGEMKSAAFLAKISDHNPESLPAETVLKMATINGAKAMGLDHLTGSLAIGKAADIIAINLHTASTMPVYHPISQIVYAASRDQVTDLWVAGRQLMKNRQLTTLQESAILEKVEYWQAIYTRIAKRNHRAA